MKRPKSPFSVYDPAVLGKPANDMDPTEGARPLVDALMDGTIDLPALPDVAIRVRRAVQAESDPNSLGRIIQSEPIIAARIIAAANSPIFGPVGSRVTNLRQATMRLGARGTQTIVTALAIRMAFSSERSITNQAMMDLWSHSTQVAATAEALGRRLPGFAGEEALLAGLVHDIGAFPLVAHAADCPDLASDPHAVDALIRHHRAEVGARMLERWAFPREMLAVPAAAEDWSRITDTGKPDYGDLVQIAQRQCTAEHPANASLPTTSELPAYRRLGLDRVDGINNEDVAGEVREEIAATQRLLLI